MGLVGHFETSPHVEQRAGSYEYISKLAVCIPGFSSQPVGANPTALFFFLPWAQLEHLKKPLVARPILTRGQNPDESVIFF